MIEDKRDIYYKIRGEAFVVFLLVAFCFGTRVVYAFLTDNFYEGWDNIARVYITYNFLGHPTLVPNQDWVFGHFWMLAFPMWIFNDFEFAPRLVSLVPSILFPIPIFYLGKRLFGEFSAILGCLFYIFALPQLMLSGSTLTAMPFSFFIITGILFLYKYEETGRTCDILGLALLFMLANSLRIEGWLYSFIVGIYLVFRERGINKNIIIYFSLIAIPIFIFAWSNYVQSGHPLYALVQADIETKSGYSFWTRDFNRLIIYFRKAFFSFSGITLFLGAIGSIIALFQRKNLFFIGIFLFTWLLLTYKIYNETLAPHFRYFTTHAIFFYILSGYFFSYFINLKQCLRIQKLILIIIPIFFFISIGSDYTAFKRENFSSLRFSDDYWNFVDKVKELNKEKSLNIYLDNYNDSDNNNYVLHYSLQYHARIYALCMTNYRFWLDEIFNIESFFQCIQNNNINAIILMPGGYFSHYVEKNKFFIEEHFIINERIVLGDYKLYLVSKK